MIRIKGKMKVIIIDLTLVDDSRLYTLKILRRRSLSKCSGAKKGNFSAGALCGAKPQSPRQTQLPSQSASEGHAAHFCPCLLPQAASSVDPKRAPIPGTRILV